MSNVYALNELRKIVLAKSFKLGKFKLSSGKMSDYYIDCRKATLDGFGAWCLATLIIDEIGDKDVDAIGGLTLGADPIVGAVLALAFRFGKTYQGFIVRKEAKGHGTGQQIEGSLEEGDRALIVEDVVTSGASALKAVEAARGVGAEVVGVFAVVDREDGGREAIEAAGLELTVLFTATELKKAAKETGCQT